MSQRSKPMNLSPIESTNNESFAKVISKAFDAAKKEDAADFIRLIASGDEIIHGAPHYMICKTWMVSLIKYMKTEKEELRPGTIFNQNILVRFSNAVVTDHTSESMCTSEQSADSNGDYVVVSSPLEKTALKSSSIGDNNYGANSWIEITRQNANDELVEDLVIKPEMALDEDFVLVGKGLWTVLSSKFGYDFSIKHLPRTFSGTDRLPSSQDGHAIVIYPDLISDPQKAHVIVSIPEKGLFDYSYEIADNDLVSENDPPTDDLFPMDGLEDSNTCESPPLLLLPPSTSIQDTAASDADNSIMIDNEPLNNSKKRKRFGSGLGNLGNTCFMNSTLQCLAHTGPICQYFLSGEYLNDLNKDNPLGTGGELASEFANLLSQMWGTGKSADSGNAYGTRNSFSSYSSSSYGSTGSVVYPRSFKTTLGKHAEQFMGYSQHDSQELATYLLDALHEDTNRVLKRPYVENPEQGEDEPDEEAAEKAWGLYLKREDSRVLESFMGQVKSRVECPIANCGRVSTTFDPCMYLSVPLPGASERTIELTYVPFATHERKTKLKVTVSKSGTIADLRNRIVDAMNTKSVGKYVRNADDIIMTDFWNKEVFSYYNNDDEIDNFRYSYWFRSGIRSIKEHTKFHYSKCV